MIESKARISSKNLQCLGRGPSFPERELAGGLNGLRLGERKADNALDLQRGKKDAPDLKFALEKPRFRIGLPSMNGAIVSTGSNHSSAAEVDGAKLPAASFGSANTSEAAVLGTRQTPTLPDVGTLESSLRSMLNLSQPGASTPLDHQRRPTPNSPLGSSQLLWPGRAPTLNSLPIPSFLSKANPPWVAGEGSSDPPVSLPKGGFNSSVPSSAKPYSPISTSLVPGVICPLCYNKEYWYFPSESEFRRHVAQLHPSEDVQDLLRRYD
ncbi:hypothetical protein BU26DRAFT_312810 [Trematosphaeria pertusa]|uniref:Uncharacterized protein n=1 Tax=Trematosphaeria pertusa TaxID=390896 RepID=A0A6A6IHV6_9PLEO|nr:uncharacterized protein BU26DRAFT_312810 [Trematosphaeria pertusa]KAF2249133.1 hypothetical protein BU26DRAFT_312810 [Trematosphaeria pertusa]